MSWLFGSRPGLLGSIALLLVRIVVGVAFVLHGWPKVQNPTGWMNGMENPPPGPVQAVGVGLEVVGGALVAVGLLTRVAVIGLAAVMAAALAMVHVPHGDPFVSATGGPSAELACLYLAISLLIAAIGPGIVSLDTFFVARRRPTSP